MANPETRPATADLKIETRTALASLAVGIVLLGIKSYAYYLTRSAAIFSDAVENVTNILTSAFAVYSILLAHRPADRDHPYGHGKVEFLAAGFEGGMIVLASLVIVAQAVGALIFSQIPHRENLPEGLWLMASAMAANGLMGGYMVYRGKKHNSLTLEADGIHLLTDALTSVVALVALLLVRWTNWNRIDPIAALLVGFYIAYMGFRLLRTAVAGLMDEQDVQDTRLLREILDSHVGPMGKEPRICNYHKLRHRHSGRYHWVDFHVMLPNHWDVERAHKVASAIEYEIELALGEGKASAHVEPCNEAECRLKTTQSE